MNYLLVASAVALKRGASVHRELRSDLSLAAAEEVAPLSIGLLLAAVGVRAATIPLLALPFVAYLGARKTVSEHEHALHDPLTGLVSRALFEDRTRQAMRHAERSGLSGSILLIDLDRFKQINDELGHQAGDAVLSEVARRLEATVRASDTVGRLGGDESRSSRLTGTATKTSGRLVTAIATAIEAPITIGRHTCSVGASVGVAHYPDEGLDVAALLARADERMYLSKQSAHRLSPTADRSRA